MFILVISCSHLQEWMRQAGHLYLASCALHTPQLLGRHTVNMEQKRNTVQCYVILLQRSFTILDSRITYCDRTQAKNRIYRKEEGVK